MINRELFQNGALSLNGHAIGNGENSYRSVQTAIRKRARLLHVKRHRVESSSGGTLKPPGLQFRWAEAISKEEWQIYRCAIHALRDAGIPFMLGGGFALATFIGRWRDTKDIDFYVSPKSREAAIKALTQAGFADYHKQRPYDRRWIYRSIQSGVIVDIIWSMANRRARVDDLWFRRAGSVVIRGQQLPVLPMEEFTWCKLYIVQRDHCDWTDILNLLYARGPEFDWSHLIWRLGDDLPVLKAAVLVYGWLCPKQARQLPEGLWRRLGLKRPTRSSRPHRERIRYLDSRGWFSGLQPRNKKLEV
jgi:hypothetical protein